MINENKEKKSLRIFVAGHKGMVGSAIVKCLNKIGYKNLILLSKNELDLIDQTEVKNFFKNEKIDQVYLAAAKVGGIYANNTFPADFIYQNTQIQLNVINSAFESGVKKLLFLGSSCIYPKYSKQPMNEEYLLTGTLEPTNEPYAISKILGIKLCESYNRQYGKSHGVDYRSIMPTNLYGPGDNYHPENSHVIPGLIYRFHEAKINNLPKVSIWGTGKPKREFLYVNDMAEASIKLMNLEKNLYEKFTKPMCSHINVGSGIELSIKELALTIKQVVGFKGEIDFDKTKPDGISRKLLNSKKIYDLGFKPETSIKNGLIKTYETFVSK
jgi:GDP-L-fucose synthase